MVIWIDFADRPSLSALLDSCDRQTKFERADATVQSLLEALAHNAHSFAPEFLADRLAVLISLRPVLSNPPSLDKLIAVALNGLLPPFHDGYLPETTIDPLLALNSHHPRASSGVKDGGAFVRGFLDQQPWTEETSSIVTKLVYIDAEARSAVRGWLRDRSQSHHASDVAPVVQALLDCEPPASWSDDDESLSRAFTLLIRDVTSASPNSMVVSRFLVCLESLRALPLSISQRSLAAMEAECHAPNCRLTSHLLAIAYRVARHDAFTDSGFVQRVVEMGLQWTSSSLADVQDVEDVLVQLTTLVHVLRYELRPHLVEILLAVVVHDHLETASAVRLAAEVVSKSKLKVSITLIYHSVALIYHLACYNQQATSERGPTPQTRLDMLLVVLQ